ncbi:TonB family protein [Candidatus Blochmannia vicinus]|uniref:Protein TonB n=1 Tax=Candidatus Blochmannia vicinus (nom. nud.) TaxID=251540 RepID=A0ABY4SXP7_9ENTR|nr:TonB family protein [Candidatus Blochmannia vicinus]URJ33091.1 TonB family protein [Candidatus Blochmannia vicinus]
MHIIIMNMLSRQFSHVVNKSIYIEKSKTFTLSFLKLDQIPCVSSEEDQSLKLLKKNHNKSNLKTITNPKQQQIVNNSKNILDSNKNFLVAEKNNIDLSEVTKNSISSFKINHNQSYVSSCVIDRIYPEYPNKAKILGIEGIVTVQYNVNIAGRVDNIRVLSAVPTGIFEESIRSAMRRWVYESNKPEKDLMITFKFFLNSSKNFSD